MTDLFTVTIDAVDGATFRARVHLLNPDINDVPREPSFPTALLAETWYDQANGFLYNEDRPGGNRCPFSEERSKEIATGMRLAGELAEIYEVVFTSEKALAERAATVVTSYDRGPEHGVPSWSAVAALHPGAGLDDRDGPADLHDERTWTLIYQRPLGEHPYVDIAVTVSDPGYLEHLVAGMRWSTTQG